MNSLLHITFLVFGLTIFANAQSGIFKPKELNNGNKGIVYDREVAAELRLLSNGFEIGLNVGTLKTYYRTEYWHFGIGELKHHREFKNRDGITGGNSIGRNTRSYIYGKQNSLYTLRVGYGIKRYYSEKARKKGLAIGVSYEGGPTLGLLKPYFLEINRTEISSGNVRPSTEKFNGDNADFFLNTDRIFGAAPAINGFDQIQFKPGIHLVGAIHFDWGAFDEYVKAIEVGIAADIFFSEIPILIDDTTVTNTGTVTNILPGNVRNRPYFLNLYISFQLGKRK